MNSNILVSFWDYFTSSGITQKDEIKKSEPIIIPKRKNYEAKTPPKIGTPSEERYIEIEKGIDAFDDEIEELEKLANSMILDNTILDNESHENFSVTKYDFTFEQIMKLQLIPVLIKGNHKYLNLIESAISMCGKNQLIIPSDVNLENIYDINYRKLKFVISVALMLDININLYLSGQKIEILTKKSISTINFLYFNRIFFPLIPISDLPKSENYCKVEF